jgi:hypothetical protein
LNNQLKNAAIGWAIAALVLSIFMITVNHSYLVLRAGLFAKVLAVLAGTVGGTLGGLIGTAIRDFTRPDVLITRATVTDAAKAKLFWMGGPQLIGWFVGSLVLAAVTLAYL